MEDQKELLLNFKLKEGEPAEIINVLGLHAITCTDGETYILEIDMIYQHGKMYSIIGRVSQSQIEKFLSFFDVKENEIRNINDIVGTSIRLVFDPVINPKWRPTTLIGRVHKGEYGGDEMPIPHVEKIIVTGKDKTFTLELTTDDTDQRADNGTGGTERPDSD